MGGLNDTRNKRYSKRKNHERTFQEIPGKVQLYGTREKEEGEMRDGKYYPTIVDYAYEIIAMYEENEHIKRELEHYKELHKINCESLKDRENHNKEFMGTFLKTALDPDSVINKGHEAIIKEQHEKLTNNRR